MFIDDNQKIGVGLTGAGCLFFVLGTMLLLDRALLTLGNILFVSGVVLIIGPMRAASFFAQPRRRKGAVCFFAGIALVLWGWTIVGMGVEAFGFVNLFGDFFPLALAIVAKLPVVGTILCGIPGIRALTERVAPGGVPQVSV
eukprot:TRINITY_DN10740_c1_g1_i1.p2 TRINITY_DN10740_c1_g1~~TRINITY_DN10740_c1_g1_i1.p2  ORF type:complete len:149 (+),score=50.94 TRINITY_DN10740_c1_g1_i1:23-448(+)